MTDEQAAALWALEFRSFMGRMDRVNTILGVDESYDDGIRRCAMLATAAVARVRAALAPSPRPTDAIERESNG